VLQKGCLQKMENLSSQGV